VVYKINNKDLFKKVSYDAVQNIIFYSIATLVIYFIKNALNWNIVALILSAIFILVVLISLIPFIISISCTLIRIPLLIKEKHNGNIEAFKDEKFMWYAHMFQLSENTVCLFLSFKLYKLLF